MQAAVQINPKLQTKPVQDSHHVLQIITSSDYLEKSKRISPKYHDLTVRVASLKDHTAYVFGIILRALENNTLLQ